MPFYTQHVYTDHYRDQIDIEAEKEYPVFRYRDLTPAARTKFSEWIKADSSIWTIRSRAKIDQISRVLRDLNPILIYPGYRGGFSHSSIFRWREKRISSLVFNSLYRRNPRNVDSWAMRYILQTPDGALVRANREFTCPRCEGSFPMSMRAYNGNCNSCERQDRDERISSVQQVSYANKSRIIELPPLSELWCGHRPSLLRRGSYQLGLGIRKLRSRWRKLGLRWGQRNYRLRD